MAKKQESGKTVTLVERLAAPIAEQMGLEIWDITFEKEGVDWILRICIEGEDGLDLEQAERFSRAIDPKLDEADPIDQSYSLEVCSPGLNRALTRDWHFERYLDEPVLLRTIRPLEGQPSRDLSGILRRYADKTVEIELENEQVVSLALADLAFIKLDDYDDAF